MRLSQLESSFKKYIFYRNEDIRPQRPLSLPSMKSVSEDGDDDMRSRFGSFSSLKRYTSKTSLISTYDFIRDKVHDAVPKSFKKKPDETKLRFVVAFFFLVIVLVISLAQIFYAQHKGQVRFSIQLTKNFQSEFQ